VNERDIADAVQQLTEQRRVEERRVFFRSLGGGGLALVGGGLVLAACGGAPPASTAPPASGAGTSAGDRQILNLALTAEYLAVDAYTRATAAGKLSGGAQGTMTTYLRQEREHVDALTRALQGMNATPAAKPSFTYPRGTFDSADSIAHLALSLEAAFVGAYLGAIAKLSASDLKKAAATIGFVEGEHRVVLRALTATMPFVDLAFEKPATAEQATAAVKPFIKS
jgi:hypothetical protein